MQIVMKSRSNNRKNLRNLVLGSLPLLLLALPNVGQAAPSTKIPKFACVNQSTGAVNLRAKCKKTETKFSASAYTTPISGLTSDLSETDATVAASSASLATANANIANLLSSLATTNSSVSTVTTDLTTASSTLSTLSSTVSSQSTSISTLTADLSTANTSLSALRPANVYNVGSGGDYATVAAAVAAAQADGVSASVPGVVRVAAGTYSATQVELIPGITVVGSGIGATILENGGSGATVRMASNSRLENLTLKDSGNSIMSSLRLNTVTGVYVRDVQIDYSGSERPLALAVSSSDARFENLTVDYTTTFTSQNFSIVSIDDSTLTFRNLRLTGSTVDESVGFYAEGTSNISIYDSFISMSDQTLMTVGLEWDSSGALLVAGSRIVSTSAGGNGPVAVITDAGTVKILNSHLECLTNSLGYGCLHAWGGATVVGNSRIESANSSSATISANNGGTITVAHTQLINGGTATSAGGTASCAGITDESNAFSAGTCP